MPSTTSLDLPAVAERYFAAWERRDPDAIAALHTPDSVFRTHLAQGPAVGRDAVREAFAGVFATFPGLTFTTDRVLYGDGFWVLDWTLRSGDLELDLVDTVEVAPDGLVARKDTWLDPTPVSGPALEPLMRMHVDLEEPQVVPTPRGTRVTYVVRAGTFEGARLRGEVLPGGGDWLLFDEGLTAGRLDVRATLRTDDGVLIHLSTRGTAVPGGEQPYIRSTLQFDCADPRYAWLDRTVAVATNRFAPHEVDYEVFAVR